MKKNLGSFLAIGNIEIVNQRLILRAKGLLPSRKKEITGVQRRLKKLSIEFNPAEIDEAGRRAMKRIGAMGGGRLDNSVTTCRLGKGADVKKI